jgi:uncharacterized membrane protein
MSLPAANVPVRVAAWTVIAALLAALAAELMMSTKEARFEALLAVAMCGRSSALRQIPGALDE